MRAVTTITGTAVPLRRSDVDTDQIIPSDWLKRVERTGFGQGLFSEWRDDPSFVLNQDRFAGAKILIAGQNFGTGSSREHAVWAITDFGFEAVISSRFADIFRNNSTKNALLPVVLTQAEVETLMDASDSDPSVEITISVDTRTVRAPSIGFEASFPLDDSVRHRFLNGLDDIGITLQHESAIDAFEVSRAKYLPSLAQTP